MKAKFVNEEWSEEDDYEAIYGSEGPESEDDDEYTQEMMDDIAEDEEDNFQGMSFCMLEAVFLGYPMHKKLLSYKKEITEVVNVIQSFNEKKMKVISKEWNDNMAYQIYIDGKQIDHDIVMGAIYAACEGNNFHRFAGPEYGGHWTDLIQHYIGRRDLSWIRKNYENYYK
jgi:hypothetical protein